MLCDVCGKNPATVHLTEIVDDQMSELHLCEECARKKSSQMESQFGLSDLLAGLAEFEKPAAEEKELSVAKCPNCGLTYKDFKKIGRLGCGECYATFKKFLQPLLKRIHGSSTHCGKCPVPVKTAAGKGPRKKTDIQELRCRLQDAVQREAYEEAARIRDQIKELQEKEQQDKGK
ncbi:MAG: UvrB/UvrC motif-containing protein [Candidatus Omnitrophica bacterium]|nr:UvrB/UvrC motif-containing protein [Candidatus Omnitrophota bacterium]